jgi:hypothetical protein
MHKVVRALHTTLLVRAVGMVEEAAYYELALEIARIEFAQLSKYISEILVGFRERLDPGFEPACQHGSDGVKLTRSVAPHLATLLRGVHRPLRWAQRAAAVVSKFAHIVELLQ